MTELTEAERAMLTGYIWGVHVSCVCHRPELWSLIDKGLLVLEDQQRVPAKNKPSFFLVLTPRRQGTTRGDQWDG